MSLAAGTLIAGRYAVQRFLGRGAQGEVYVVIDTHEGPTVALKLLGPLPAGGPWQEAQILRRLADPHILPIRNADLAAGQPYLVTELATHGTVEAELLVAGQRGRDTDDVAGFEDQLTQEERPATRRTISINEAATRDAPPTRAPSTSDSATKDAMLSGVTLPP